MKQITLEEYESQFNGMPSELIEFAQCALDISDDPEFVEAAQAYLDAMEAFRNMMDERGIEPG